LSTGTFKFAVKPAIRQRFRFLGEDGASLVETAISCLILIPVLFGIIQLSFALYCYTYAANAARMGARWAMVRGAGCTGNFNAAYCSPVDASGTGATANDIAQYVKGLGFPFSGNVTTSVKWCTYSGSTPATWTACSTTQNNSLGNQVQVKVSYAYPLIIPFLPSNTASIGSVASMTIVQ